MNDEATIAQIVILLGISWLVSYFLIGDFAVSMLIVGIVSLIVNKTFNFIVKGND